MSEIRPPDDWSFVDTANITFEQSGEGFLDEAASEWWRHKIPLSPERFLANLADGLPGNAKLVIGAVDPARNWLDFRLVGTEAGSLLWKAERSLDFHSNIAFHHRIFIPEAHRGQRTGRLFLKNSIELYPNLGIEQVYVTAKSIGAYVWLRMGFLPEAAAWNNLINMKLPLRERLDDLAPYMDAREDGIARAALAQDNPLAVRLILGLDRLIGSPEDENGLRPVRFRLLAQAGITWYGMLDLSDNDSMALFWNYVRE